MLFKEVKDRLQEAFFFFFLVLKLSCRDDFFASWHSLLKTLFFFFFSFFCHFRGFKAPKWSGEKGGSETEAAIESKEGGEK